MKKVVLSLGVLLLLGAAIAFAQGPTPPATPPPAKPATPPAMPPMGGMGGTAWGMGSPYNRMYNTATAETLKGVVVSVDSFSTMGAMPGAMQGGRQMSGMQPGIRAMLKTDKDTVSVHLGPAWFIENQDTQILPRDSIQVKGSRITFNDKPAIMASEITKGHYDLRLRDKKGAPAWCAWRRQ